METVPIMNQTLTFHSFLSCCWDKPEKPYKNHDSHKKSYVKTKNDEKYFPFMKNIQNCTPKYHVVIGDSARFLKPLEPLKNVL